MDIKEIVGDIGDKVDDAMDMVKDFNLVNTSERTLAKINMHNFNQAGSVSVD
jgi:hypothetical protein